MYIYIQINFLRIYLSIKEEWQPQTQYFSGGPLPCLIHTFQLIIKDSLLSESNKSVSIAKARQTVRHFNNSSTACEELKSIHVTLGSSDSMQKALLLVQDVETRLNSTYLMLKRLVNLKLSVQSYVANNNNFKHEYILSADVR